MRFALFDCVACRRPTCVHHARQEGIEDRYVCICCYQHASGMTSAAKREASEDHPERGRTDPRGRRAVRDYRDLNARTSRYRRSSSRGREETRDSPSVVVDLLGLSGSIMVSEQRDNAPHEMAGDRTPEVFALTDSSASRETRGEESLDQVDALGCFEKSERLPVASHRGEDRDDEACPFTSSPVLHRGEDRDDEACPFTSLLRR